MSNALAVQVGGSHYKMWKVQPVEVYFKYNLNAFEANILKYGSRFLFKNGAEDLDKMLHYAELYSDFILDEVETTGIKSGSLLMYSINPEAIEYFIENNLLDDISPVTARILRIASRFLQNPANKRDLNELATETRLVGLEIYGR